ncbi:contactin-associated protein-like 2 [Glandiceps talaboti]
MACNCDMNDDELRIDHGEFVNKDILPVSKVCIGVSEDDVPGTDHDRKLQRYTFQSLMCAPEQFDIYKDCQERRSIARVTQSEPWIIDPDGDGPSEPFPVYCEMLDFPPLGVTVIHHKNEGSNSVNEDPESVVPEYFHASPSQLEALTTYEEYCTQSLSYSCHDAILDLSEPYGWYDKNGIHMLFWAGSTTGIGCAGGECQCSQIDGQQHTDEGLIIDDNSLPISKVELPAADQGSTRTLNIGPLTCSGLFRNCHEILLAGQTYNPNLDNKYAIDPDQGGDLLPFSVYCDFVSNPGIGISKIVTIYDIFMVRIP